jgi:hypothetical protein
MKPLQKDRCKLRPFGFSRCQKIPEVGPHLEVGGGRLAEECLLDRGNGLRGARLGLHERRGEGSWGEPGLDHRGILRAVKTLG